MFGRGAAERRATPMARLLRDSFVMFGSSVVRCAALKQCLIIVIQVTLMTYYTTPAGRCVEYGLAGGLVVWVDSWSIRLGGSSDLRRVETGSDLGYPTPEITT